MIRLLSLGFFFLLFFRTDIEAQGGLILPNGAVLNIQNGATLAVPSLTLEKNSTLNNAGNLAIANDFTDNSVSGYSYGSGVVVFSGSGMQSITSNNQFERIEVNNNGLTFGSNIKSHNWVLVHGKVITGNYMAVITSSSNTSLLAGTGNTDFSQSWFIGNLRRYINSSTVNNYKFPVGNASNVNLAEFDNLLASPLVGTNYITASFGPKLGTDMGLSVSELGTAYNEINNGGVWYLTPDINPIGGRYTLKLHFTGFSGLNDDRFGILKRPDLSNNAADWVVPPESSLPPTGNPGRIVAPGYALRENISTFSQFGIGMSQVALPLQLLSFTANRKDKTALLQWVTSDEKNVSRFEIYKGTGITPLRFLGSTPARNNNGSNNLYQYTDNSPSYGMNYYQLKIFDFDNRFKTSTIEVVRFDDMNTIRIYPNPIAGGKVFIEYSGARLKDIRLIGTNGMEIPCTLSAQNGNIYQARIPEYVAKGIYVLQLNTEKGIRNIQISIQ
ncbi:MAG: T9SS type A sorting domain-containing protein [Ferruginibacter sp.]|nr:T9SS type A sorting domain-containing protein [Ferruginibacter sp.]